MTPQQQHNIVTPARTQIQNSNPENPTADPEDETMTTKIPPASPQNGARITISRQSPKKVSTFNTFSVLSNIYCLALALNVLAKDYRFSEARDNTDV